MFCAGGRSVVEDGETPARSSTQGDLPTIFDIIEGRLTKHLATVVVRWVCTPTPAANGHGSAPTTNESAMVALDEVAITHPKYPHQPTAENGRFDGFAWDTTIPTQPNVPDR